MQHISGISREQISFTSLEDFISANHEVQFIDAFVHELDLVKLGFQIQTVKKEGRPSYGCNPNGSNSKPMKPILYNPDRGSPPLKV